MTSQKQERKFVATSAKRTKVPLSVGIMSPSGCGKTYSALRLARGMQRVTGGKIVGIDTENQRMLHYAYDPKDGSGFEFEHIPFVPPYSPADYLSAMKQAVAMGARVCIIDSGSHEHAGIGGVLEMHAEEHQRLGGKQSTKMLAWGLPKRESRRMIDGMLQLPCHFIWCWRAKNKLKIEKGEDPSQLGCMPVADLDHVYEMTVNFLLLPGEGKGYPVLSSDKPGERMLLKVPGQFEHLIKQGVRLNEDIGEAMARWADGETISPGNGSRPSATTNGNGNGQHAPTSQPSAAAKFSERLPWSGLEDWGGKLLTDAPVASLRLYREAVEAATTDPKMAKKADALREHLRAVDHALSAKAPADAADPLDDDDGPPANWQPEARQPGED